MQQLNIRTTRRYGALSPLRYPGGKASLAGFFGDLIADLGINEPTYVEPYAGGAGAGIALLRHGLVNHLVINDFDVAVYSFWKAITECTDTFINLVRTTPLNVDEWRKQREIYREGQSEDFLELGFAFFYLNRTNRSGVLSGGVIGGLDQSGNYKMDARFNRETLSERIAAIGSLSDSITVSDLDGRTVIQNYAHDASAFMYIDPPYVHAGPKLYLNSFGALDHHALSRTICDVPSAQWLVTYDTSDLIERLYVQHFQCLYSLTYSARYPGLANEMMIASPKLAEQLVKWSGAA